MSAIAPHLLAV